MSSAPRVSISGSRASHQDAAEKLNINNRLETAKTKLAWVSGSAFLQSLRDLYAARLL